MVIYLDIETAGKSADEGEVIAIGLLKGNRVEVRLSEEPGGERRLLEWLEDELEEGETVVTWYGSGFDIPFLLARSALLGVELPRLCNAPKLDLCEWCRQNLKLSSYGLESVSKFLGIEREVEFAGKDVPTLHKLALEGDEKARSLIARHCEEDLRLLRGVHEKLKPYVEVGSWRNSTG